MTTPSHCSSAGARIFFQGRRIYKSAEKQLRCDLALAATVLARIIHMSAVNKFLILLSKSVTEYHQDSKEEFQKHVPPYESIRRWMKRLREGKTSTEDEIRSGRPPTATSPDLIEIVATQRFED